MCVARVLQRAQPKPAPKHTIPPPRPITATTKIIGHPVRSGQRIYATGGDLDRDGTGQPRR
jgi:septum formation inhibitor MinC